MAKFIFRFDSFLTIKEKIEEQKKQAYGKAVQQLEADREILRSLEQKQRGVIDRLKQIISEGVSPKEIERHNTFISHLKILILTQKETIEISKKIAEEKREELVESMKELKMYETLKEKDLETFKEEQKIIEGKIVDEVVSYKFQNRNTEV